MSMRSTLFDIAKERLKEAFPNTLKRIELIRYRNNSCRSPSVEMEVRLYFEDKELVEDLNIEGGEWN